jgi:hypothetical protein
MTDDKEFLRRAIIDPEFLLDRIDIQLAAADPADLPMVVLSADDAMSGRYRSVEEGRPRHAVLEALLNLHGDLIEGLCARIDYCARKKRHAESLNMIKAVVDGLISASIQLPLPMATVGAYCVQSLYLDRVCECDDC